MVAFAASERKRLLQNLVTRPLRGKGFVSIMGR